MYLNPKYITVPTGFPFVFCFFFPGCLFAAAPVFFFPGGNEASDCEALIFSLFKGDSRDPQQWDPLMVSFPYCSHTIPIRIPKDMGMIWEASHKGGPIVGGP